MTEPALAGFPPLVALAVKVILCLAWADDGLADNVMLLLACANSAARNGMKTSKASKLIERINLRKRRSDAMFHLKWFFKSPLQTIRRAA